nr:leucyl/phenylalanyl-tRNA--protein transferase [Kribbia dieselivorans]
MASIHGPATGGFMPGGGGWARGFLPYPPREPEPSRWLVRPTRVTPGDDLVALGADLAPGTLLEAYRNGVFPMGIGEHGAPPIGWWSPDPRGVLWPGHVKVSRSLRKSARHYRVSSDEAFDAVVEACADPAREGRWITPEIQAAYGHLHRLGWAHSIEVWDGPDLVGGLYGVALGGLFAGESMFHLARDASKVALLGLVAALTGDGDPRRIIDVQWATDHLRTLGVTEVSRRQYLTLVRRALPAPQVDLARWPGWAVGDGFTPPLRSA